MDDGLSNPFSVIAYSNAIVPGWGGSVPSFDWPFYITISDD